MAADEFRGSSDGAAALPPPSLLRADDGIGGQWRSTSCRTPLVKALHARAGGAGVDNLEGWLFRIAHNASLDFLRERSRNRVVPLTEDVEAAPMPEADIVAISFQTFLRLPELQRCAVILKDVLGHSVEEIAVIADCTPAAAKSALQRGRVALRDLAQRQEDTRLPLLADADRQKMAAYVQHFRTGDFDAIRALLAADVKLELVNRLKMDGREAVGPYFTRYAEVEKWQFALGAVEGPAGDAGLRQHRPHGKNRRISF